VFALGSLWKGLTWAGKDWSALTPYRPTISSRSPRARAASPRASRAPAPA
jgi:hypothetical protein